MDNKKVCNKCKVEKELTEFYKNKARKDGLTTACKDCIKKNNKQYKKTDSYKIKKRERQQTEEYKKYQKEYKQSLKYKEYVKKYNSKLENKIKSFIRNCKHRTKDQNICSEEDLKKCLEAFNYCDAYTGEPLKDNVSFDHIIPIAKGGQSTINNIVPCKKEINQDKRNSTLKIWYIEQPFYTEERYNKIKLWIKSN